MPKDKKDRIPESKLLKALAELEDVAKGDALEEADPEGGLSTEGEPLSDGAPRGRGEQTKKSRGRGSSPFGDSASSSSDSSDDDDDDDDASSDASSPAPPPKKEKKDKKAKVRKAADSSSEDDDDGAEKSFREMADGDETMRKGLLVNDFLTAMTDQLSLALLHVKESIAKSIAAAEARLAERIDDHFAKSTASRREFDVRLAKGIAAIGTAVHGELLPMADMVKALSDQPAPAPRGKAVLSKGEVNQPPWGGPASGADRNMANGSDGETIEALRAIPTNQINNWLFDKIAKSQIDQNVSIAFEADRYDPAFLPPAVRKALADDFIK